MNVEIDLLLQPQTVEVYKQALMKVQEAQPGGIDLKTLARGAANPGPAHWKLMRHAFSRMLILGKLKLNDAEQKKAARKSPGAPPLPPKPTDDELVRLTGKIRQLAVKRAFLANRLIPNPIEEGDIAINIEILDEMKPIVDEMEELEIQRSRLAKAGYIPAPQIEEPIAPEAYAHNKAPIVVERNGKSYTIDQLYSLSRQEIQELRDRLVKAKKDAKERKTKSQTEKARRRNEELEVMTEKMITALDRVRFDKKA